VELKKPLQTEQGASGSKQPAQSVLFEQTMHTCGVCIVQCGSEIVLRSHFNGKKHAKKMEQATDSKDNRPTPYLYCSICDVTSMSKRNLVMHFNGKRHAKNMKEDSNSGNSSYYSDSEIEF
jgi:Pyruvate/2-oxoacid:ferredoxin oxidoreductase delta subunit